MDSLAFRRFIEGTDWGSRRQVAARRVIDAFERFGDGDTPWTFVGNEVDAAELQQGWTEYKRGLQDGAHRGAKKKHTLFDPTVVRFHSTGTFVLVNQPAKGWSSYGHEYSTLNDLLDEWDVRLGPHGQDGCSAYIEAHPVPRSPT